MMIVGVLTVTLLSCLVVLLVAHLSRGWANETIELLAATRNELRPALVTVRHDAQRSAELRHASITDSQVRYR